VRESAQFWNSPKFQSLFSVVIPNRAIENFNMKKKKITSSTYLKKIFKKNFRKKTSEKNSSEKKLFRKKNPPKKNFRKKNSSEKKTLPKKTTKKTKQVRGISIRCYG